MCCDRRMQNINCYDNVGNKELLRGVKEEKFIKERRVNK
jgi:hypothetical protein